MKKSCCDLVKSQYGRPDSGREKSVCKRAVRRGHADPGNPSEQKEPGALQGLRQRLGNLQ